MKIEKNNVKIVLVCPLCFHDEWVENNTPGTEKEYECCYCHKIAYPEEMIARIVETDT